MKADELMIGDWVYNKNINKPMQIYPMIFSQMFRSNPKATTEDYNIFPIPLTPEILEKIGFESQHNVGYVLERYDDDTIIVDLWNRTLKILMNYKVVFEKEYFDTIPLHELQHALRLCGIEKEIEL
jgi:hypothetical protein